MNEIALHILDIVQNSIRAKANIIEVVITEKSADNLYQVEINDNGCGVEAQVLKNIADPFYTTRTTRKVGLGIALFKQSAEQSGGTLQVDSEKGKGTRLKAVFEYSHFDRPMLGDVAGTMTLLIGSNPQICFIYKHITAIDNFVLDTREVRKELDDIPLTNPAILKGLKSLIEENLKQIEAKIY